MEKGKVEQGMKEWEMVRHGRKEWGTHVEDTL